ncbi:MAG: c-type cytochrome [Limisphaerales bacterium]
MKLRAGVIAVSFVAAICGRSEPQLTEAQRNTIIFESLSRLQNVDLESDPQLKDAVYQLLQKVRGTDKFLEIVKRFHLKDCDPGLIALALKAPGSETGVEATRLVLAHKNFVLLKKRLESSDIKIATATAEALGDATEKDAVGLLLPIAVDANRESALRKACIRALARTSEGATALLDLAKQGALAEDLKFTASTELNGVHWTNIKSEAAKVLPLPLASGSQPLPSTVELLKMNTDAVIGEKVFYRQLPGCAACHTIRGKGGQVGPDLSEIGTKLAREAIVEAILEPSAGISVGYETYSLDLKSGDDAYGLLVSETADDIAIKDSKGIVTHYKKSEVLNKRKLKTSMMPTGLQQGMTAQEFADLVAFLSGLKKQ